MLKIKILPEILSNKIAAGEVVERPASVVKELLENAMDAESKKITVEIGQGGRSLIRVSDNGVGMSHDDALLAIERYATSKIHTDADLYAISTLGFRGEALPSIASVSKFTLITKTRSDEAATRIDIEGGRIKNVCDAGASDGTSISVHQLFYNTPARRKFLKSATTEMGHIAETVACCALARPDIQFRLVHNGKEIKNWPPVRSPLDRVIDVLGDDLKSSLYPLALDTPDLSVSGWTSDPSVTRSTSQKIYIFVNGRLIRDRGVQYALFEGYRGRIMRGRFPVAVLFLKLPADQVDVNVHPAKHEVRFARQREVYSAVKNSVTALWQHPEPLPWEDPPAPEVRENRPSWSGTFHKKTVSTDVMPPQKTRDPAPLPEPERRTPPPDFRNPEPSVLPPEKSPESRQAQLWERRKLADARIIGQFNNTYILCEGNNALIVVDQHAAHERIAYERIAAARKNNVRPPSQKLMIPETFDLGYRETAVISQMTDDLGALGLEIEHFGGNTFVVKSVPALLADREIKPLILEIAEAMDGAGYSPGLSVAMDQCIILMACHSAIRARQSLSGSEMKALLDQLDQCENPRQCPHGRPTFVEWPIRTLEKNFKRIV